MKDINELDFSDEEKYEKYKASHKIKPSTKITVKGKSVRNISNEKTKSTENDKTIKQIKKELLSLIHQKPFDKKKYSQLLSTLREKGKIKSNRGRTKKSIELRDIMKEMVKEALRGGIESLTLKGMDSYRNSINVKGMSGKRMGELHLDELTIRKGDVQLAEKLLLKFIYQLNKELNHTSMLDTLKYLNHLINRIPTREKIKKFKVT